MPFERRRVPGAQQDERRPLRDSRPIVILRPRPTLNESPDEPSCIVIPGDDGGGRTVIRRDNCWASPSP